MQACHSIMANTEMLKHCTHTYTQAYRKLSIQVIFSLNSQMLCVCCTRMAVGQTDFFLGL